MTHAKNPAWQMPHLHVMPKIPLNERLAVELKIAAHFNGRTAIEEFDSLIDEMLDALCAEAEDLRGSRASSMAKLARGKLSKRERELTWHDLKAAREAIALISRTSAKLERLRMAGQECDLEPLIELLQSEKSTERGRGAFYLDEADPPADLMANVVIKLADDPISHCRWRFVAYVTNSRLYSDAIADRLATCLLDRDLYVRARAIFWAVVVEEETFAHFSKAVLSGAGTKKYEFTDTDHNIFWRESERRRALRGIEIAKRLRTRESVASIRESMPAEDSFVFDELAFSDRAIKRALERRAADT